MSCPPQSLNGFANLTTIPGPSDLNSIAMNTYPFIMNFAPRTTALTITGNTLNEDLNNTLLHNGNQYNLSTATICKPSSGSYELYGTVKKSQASLIFTFLSNTIGSVITQYTSDIQQKKQSTYSSTPLAIILIVPIFQSATPTANTPYLTQLSNPATDTRKFMSMKGLFANLTSIGYSACVDIVLQPNTPPTLGCPVKIYNFTDGITIQNDINTIMSNKPIPPYTFIRDASIIQSYTADHSPIFTNASSCPTILPPISIAGDDIFKDKMIYYLLPIANSKRSSAKPKNLKPEQYQCFPFDELQNLQTDPSGVKTVGNLGEVIKTQETQNQTVGAMLSWDQLKVFVIAIGSLIGAFIAISLIIWAISYFGDRTLPDEAVATVGTAVGATTAAAVVAATAKAPA